MEQVMECAELQQNLWTARKQLGVVVSGRSLGA